MPTEPTKQSPTAHDVWSLMQGFVDANSRKRELADVLGFGLGAGRGKVLFRLRGGPMTLSELAKAQGVDAPYATVIVDKLESLGLVERKPHPDDNRRKLVGLTAAGKKAVTLADKMLSVPPPALKELSTTELETLDQLLKRVGAKNRGN